MNLITLWCFNPSSNRRRWIKGITTSLFKIISTLKFWTIANFLQHEFQYLYNIFLWKILICSAMIFRVLEVLILVTRKHFRCAKLFSLLHSWGKVITSQRRSLLCQQTCLNFFAFLFSFASEESQEGEKPTKSQILVVLNSSFKALLSHSPNKSLHVLGVFQTVWSY